MSTAKTLAGRKAIIDALGVSDYVARKWIALGAPVLIEHSGVGSRWYADAEELERWRRGYLARSSLVRTPARPSTPRSA